ncbi:hypothetical protein [Roseivirga misakiensis]|uniref:DUF4468 domain-containing protein n=1 Tax=Roseivirga misakiensis TaxID=1563681 RepID=A0A1E5SZI1_9BACT|nr:hypothetical protein [Roseivirga misakiensis]OEK04515.1 hypothetical protein BFP71_13690 [Roseivirga misakiensis]
MKRFTTLIILLFLLSPLMGQESIDDIAKQIRESQLKDETSDWVHFGTFDYTVKGVDNKTTSYLRVEENTTVRMYLLAKTDCYMYFDVRNQKESYVFGTNDPLSLETDLKGYKAATSIYTTEKEFMMNINYGLRWGCEKMIDTEMRLIVFYVNKNADD